MPDIVGPITGWRVHIIDAGHLWSPTYRTRWPVGDWLSATCRLPPPPKLSGGVRWVPSLMAWVPATARTPPPTSHHPPAPTCRCGIYVVREPNTALDRAWITDRSLAHALVQIEAAGRYIEYDDGWRVERARIAAIVDGRITGPDPELHDVSDRYQVPLIEAPFDINFEEPAEPAKPSYHTTTASRRSYHYTGRAIDVAPALSAINELQRQALVSIAAIKKMIKDVDGDET